MIPTHNNLSANSCGDLTEAATKIKAKDGEGAHVEDGANVIMKKSSQGTSNTEIEEMFQCFIDTTPQSMVSEEIGHVTIVDKMTLSPKGMVLPVPPDFVVKSMS